MLDFTHVLAGPRSARTLAEYGAEVLHISSPWSTPTPSPSTSASTSVSTTAYLDLRYDKGHGDHAATGRHGRRSSHPPTVRQ